MRGLFRDKSTAVVATIRARFASDWHIMVDAPLNATHRRRQASASKPDGHSDPLHCSATRSMSFGEIASNRIGLTFVGTSSSRISWGACCGGGCFSLSRSFTKADLSSDSVTVSPIWRTPTDAPLVVSSARVCSARWTWPEAMLKTEVARVIFPPPPPPMSFPPGFLVHAACFSGHLP